ncbi:MAG TPA: class I SAM-dependent methyltransferase [Chitinophagaceae bacterium]|nr:class I SAM-dependent methyltransferase [Chitinophagaceae bacterium]
MKRNYWEKIAPSYNEEIFDVLQNDKKGLIREAIVKIASPRKSVLDIGCAIGKWLPVLAPLFKKVIAVDISAKNLAIARSLNPQFNNIAYLRADMSDTSTRLPLSEAGICINAILTPSQKDRAVFFKALSSCIRKKGHIILTIPSLESYLLTQIIAHQWKIDADLLNKKISGKQALSKWKNIQQGNADIDGVPHKHYLKEELELLLVKEKFALVDLKKIEYDWTTEFIKPPRWLKEPRPWDWMVVAQKL